ncbi:MULTISPECIES: hypothetical protein [Rhodomicrobium]|uniref:hypothetical protein n=1 Tax=Rhodomicrobium TaxID=1068 RepID=UPI000B4AF357|nr:MULTISPECIES: hypothetical protein [Rhodomicrobium]
MLNWTPATTYGVQPFAAGPFHLLMPYGGAAPRKSRPAAKEPLPGDFPDYLTFVTRQSLLAFTTSLTKISSDVHLFFVRLNNILMFDRMMRSMMSWGMPGAAQAGFGLAQPWLTPAPQPQPQAQHMLSFWGAVPAEVKALPAPQPDYAAQATQQLALAQASFPVFAAMMAVPAAFMSCAPAMMDAWRVAL